MCFERRLATDSRGRFGTYVPYSVSKVTFSPTTTIRCLMGVRVRNAISAASGGGELASAAIPEMLTMAVVKANDRIFFMEPSLRSSPFELLERRTFPADRGAVL